MQEVDEVWRVILEMAKQAVPGAVPPFCAYAVTTGEAAQSETTGSVTVQQVPVWLNGVSQTEANKTMVVLPHGVPVPGAGELWLVLLPNFAPPGVLAFRLSQ